MRHFRFAFWFCLSSASHVAMAGVPIDSLNSANAGLNPALNVERTDIVPTRRTGAADALRVMALAPRLEAKPATTIRDPQQDEAEVPIGVPVVTPEN